MLIFSACMLPSLIWAQEDTGNKVIAKQLRELPAFSKIEVGGAFDVFLTQGDQQMVEVETDANLQDVIQTKVEENTLKISSKNIKKFTCLNVYITIPEVTKLEISGAAELQGKSIIKGDQLYINASGASETDLELDINTLRTEISGASDVKLTGKAFNHSTDVSGAATLDVEDLLVEKTVADVSGAGTAKVNKKGDVIGNVSGAGNIQYEGQIIEEGEAFDAEEDVENDEDIDNEIIVISEDDDDTMRVKIPGVNIEINEDEDTVRIKTRNKVIIIDDNGHVKFERCKRIRFNGHWAGFDIGLDGYADPNFSMNFPKDYEYMDLRMEKSVAIGINFFEQNIPLSKNQKWGMLTGLGLGFNDYRFLKPTYLNMDSSKLEGYLFDDISIRKSKLSAMYLTLPVLFEFQTNPWQRKNSFHIGIGMVISARLSSHTKVYFNELNSDYNLKQYNPKTDNYETVLTGTSPNEPKVHEYDDWFLRPFKFDATVRIGWGVINLFATYSVQTLFRDGKGPELYPWSAGITLINF